MQIKYHWHPTLPAQHRFYLDVSIKRHHYHLSQERMAVYLGISIGAYKLIKCKQHIPKTPYFLLICWKLHLNPFCYLHDALEKEGLDVSVLDKETETV